MQDLDVVEFVAVVALAVAVVVDVIVSFCFFPFRPIIHLSVVISGFKNSWLFIGPFSSVGRWHRVITLIVPQQWQIIVQRSIIIPLLTPLSDAFLLCERDQFIETSFSSKKRCFDSQQMDLDRMLKSIYYLTVKTSLLWWLGPTGRHAWAVKKKSLPLSMPLLPPTPPHPTPVPHPPIHPGPPHPLSPLPVPQSCKWIWLQLLFVYVWVRGVWGGGREGVGGFQYLCDDEIAF